MSGWFLCSKYLFSTCLLITLVSLPTQSSHHSQAHSSSISMLKLLGWTPYWESGPLGFYWHTRSVLGVIFLVIELCCSGQCVKAYGWFPYFNCCSLQTEASISPKVVTRRLLRTWETGGTDLPHGSLCTYMQIYHVKVPWAASTLVCYLAAWHIQQSKYWSHSLIWLHGHLRSETCNFQV